MAEDICKECGDYVGECFCSESEPPTVKYEMTVTCDRCGYSGSIDRVRVHSCYVQEQGGRCEDYPCCGHT